MKTTLLILVLTAAAGAWVGINFVNDRPLFSNPFEDQALSNKAGDLVDDSREALGESLREAADGLTNKK